MLKRRFLQKVSFGNKGWLSHLFNLNASHFRYA